jgi:predicted dinucleotide-binding enzyme
MDIAMLGTGQVGITLGTRLVDLGHRVVMGSRDAANPRAAGWAGRLGQGASSGTFADAARAGEIVVNATAGVASLDALHAAGADALAGKVLLDVANALDFSAGFPPRVLASSDDSLAERIQRAFPSTRVVKALNSMNCDVMVDPAGLAGGDHDVFVAGDDAGAKETVRGLLREMGWSDEHVVDLGALAAARGTEMFLQLWLTLMQQAGTANFNVRVVRG